MDRMDRVDVLWTAVAPTELCCPGPSGLVALSSSSVDPAALGFIISLEKQAIKPFCGFHMTHPSVHPFPAPALSTHGSQGVCWSLHMNNYGHISCPNNQGFSCLGLYADFLRGAFFWHLSVQFFPNSWCCLAC